MRHFLFSIAIVLLLISCGQNSNTKKETSTSPDTATGKPDTATAKPAMGEYSFDKHSDINAFISDLSKAVSANDKNGIAQMINFPLADEWGDNPANQSPALGCKTPDQFMENYDKIFVSQLKDAIIAKKIRAHDNSNKDVPDVIEKGEYLIEYPNKEAGKRPDIMLGIKKVGDLFKIYAIKFYS